MSDVVGNPTHEDLHPRPFDPDYLTAYTPEGTVLGDPHDFQDGKYFTFPIKGTPYDLDELIYMHRSGKTSVTELDIDGEGNGNIHNLSVLTGAGRLSVFEHQRDGEVGWRKGIQRYDLLEGDDRTLYPGMRYQIQMLHGAVIRRICADYNPALERERHIKLNDR